MVARAGVQVTSENNPDASREHGILSREDLAEDTGAEGTQDTSELEDGGEPTSSTGRADDGREVVNKARHNERLSKDTLLIAVLKPAKSLS